MQTNNRTKETKEQRNKEQRNKGTKERNALLFPAFTEGAALHSPLHIYVWYYKASTFKI